MSALQRTSINRRLYRIIWIAVGLLMLKTLFAILAEYRWYLPPNFDESAFLGGRRYSFVGLYRTAFYGHIISGPFTILLGTFLMISSNYPGCKSKHRFAGRIQILVVLFLVVPSGIVMAMSATSGPIAAWGFGSLSIATAVCAVAAMHTARAGQIVEHRCWATRCFVLLCSPLLLRLISGALIVTDLESEFFYRLNAWVSWMVPLAVYEITAWYTRSDTFSSTSSGALRRAIGEPYS